MGSDSREYESSHPWLTFDVTRQLDRAPARRWRLLGAVASLAQYLGETPMLPAYARKMHEVALVKGAVATTAIEGNTLSEEEVQRLLKRELRLPPSKEYLGTEVANMLEAFNKIMAQVSKGEQLALTADSIMEWNRQVLNGLDLEEGVVPGEISEHRVVVGLYRGAPRRDCRYLLGRLCSWLEGTSLSGGGAAPAMEDAILRALLAHLYLAWIHPFGDGNGRTARLIEFQILANGGVPGPAAHLLSNHFNDTRSEYYRQLSHASRSGGEVSHFLIYALQGLFDGLRQQLDQLRGQTEDLIWREFVEEAIPGHQRPDHRRRTLAIAIFRSGEPVVRRADMVSLTPDLARAYVDKTDKTPTRDLHVLVEIGLLRAEGKGRYRSTRELIQGLMPPGRR